MTVQATELSLDSLPEIDLRQLVKLTDDTGMLQHATYGVPDHHHGYCVDDNCRALIAAVMYSNLKEYNEQRMPLERYLAFIAYAFNPEMGRFRNFMSYDRQWLEEVGSEDSHSRTLWALGMASAFAPNDSIAGLAKRLFKDALPAAERFPHIRPWAFTLLGLDAYLRGEPSEESALAAGKRLAHKLLDALRENQSEDWPWWEDVVTYDNAKLPHALVLWGKRLGTDDMLEAGIKCLEWLVLAQTHEDGHFTIIGNNGWFTRDGRRAKFDQQPLEAHALVHACLAAAEVKEDAAWRDRALRALAWFLGRNDLNLPLYNADTGGCHDGLQRDGLNENQGAESTLAYVMSVLEAQWFKERGAASPAVSSAILSLALVGVSGFGKFALDSFSRIDGLNPAAVWNRTFEKAEKFGREEGLKVFRELEDLAASDEVDIVYIATSPAQHAEQGLAALRGGKHVFIEKPLAIKLEDAREMEREASDRGLRLGVNFMMRFGPLWKPMKDLFDSRLLGVPLRGMMTNVAGDDGLPQDHWFWDCEESGGIFVEHGVHFFDLVRSWIGKGKVLCAHQKSRRGTDLVDQVACDVAYGDQTSVAFYHGFHQRSPMERQTLRIIFEKGDVTLYSWLADEIELNAMLTDAESERLREIFPEADLQVKQRLQGNEMKGSRRTGRALAEAIFTLRWKASEDKDAVYRNALKGLMEDFVKSVRDPSHSPRVSAADGIAALELAVSADKLARSK